MKLVILCITYFTWASQSLSGIGSAPSSDLDSANILARLSKIGHSEAKSDTFDLSNYDIEKLVQQPRDHKANKPERFKSARFDQKLRGLEQLNSMYQVLKNGEPIHKNPETNTIRFVPSIKTVHNKKPSFIFNLSMLGESEKILSVELYMNRRQLRFKPLVNLHYVLGNKANLNDMMPDVLNSSIASVIDLSGLRQRRRRTNWHQFDLVDSVSSFLKTRFNRLKFGQINNNYISRGKNFYYTFDKKMAEKNQLEDLILMVDSSRFGNVHPRLEPYLIIYSREAESEMKNFFKNRLPNDLSEDKKKTGFDLENHVYQQPEQVYHSKDSSIKLIETKKMDNFDQNKSDLFNYLPDYKQNLNLNNIELIFKDHSRNKRDLDSRENLNEANWTSFLLPWDDERWNHDLNETKKEKIKCQTKPLIVDFHDLSFSDWIIEPKRFHGNYCDGSCKHPYNKVIFE